jgi:hypothetical protein
MISCSQFGVSELENCISLGRLPYLKAGKMIQVASFDSTGGNNDRINIHAGKTATIAELKGPGVITRIWLTIDSRDPYFLRRILLRFYWDGEENPSVEVPVGDFFGTGFGYKHYIAQFIGMTSGGYYCYFPMPFNKSARIEVVNETGQEIYAFYYHINYYKLENPLEDDVAYFHAQWNRDIRTDYNGNYTILEAEGEGHFVGVNMSMQPYGRSLWYLEGDEMIYVDGEKFPSIYGTGTEDYFTSGWYFKNGEFSAPFHGLIIKDEETGRIAAYRHHIRDAIPFKKSIKVTIEHGHGNAEIVDFSSLAYWYQKEPHKKFKPIKEAGLRIPLRVVIPNGAIEAEDLQLESQKVIGEPESMAAFGAEWSGLTHLKVRSPEKGATFTLTIPSLTEIGYTIDAYFTKGPEYGKVDIYCAGKKVGEYDGYNEEIFPGGKVRLENLDVINGAIKLKFAAAGKNEKSSGTDIGIDCFVMHPKRVFIPEWYMIGPFPNERESDILRYGLDTVYPPEKEIDYSKTYTGADGQTVAWKKYTTPENGYISLWDKFKPYEFVVSYAITYIYSPKEQSVDLLLGSDDGAKVFLNGEELYRFLDVRISAPDQDRVSLNLKKGWNELLVKIENNFGGWAFYARVIDPKKNLIFSVNKQK